MSARRLLHNWSTVTIVVGGLTLASTPIHSASGVVHAVQGRGWTGDATGEFDFHVSVRESEDGRVWGWTRFDYFEGATGFELNNAAKVDCLEVDTATGEAWVSGVLTKSEQPDILPVGAPVVAYIKDGGPHGTDLHAAAGLFPGETCHDRPDLAAFAGEVLRGNYVVR
jgi:hypothetical protein